MALDRPAIAGGALGQALLLGAVRDGGHLSLAFLLAGLVGGAIAGMLAPRDGQPWLDGFAAGALGLGLYLLWVVAVAVGGATGRLADPLAAAFLAGTTSAWVGILVGPFHAVGGLVGAALVDATRRRLARSQG